MSRSPSRAASVPSRSPAKSVPILERRLTSSPATRSFLRTTASSITRGLQEWACLLPQELPFVSVARLLGWQIHDATILFDTTIRSLVRMHGLLIRQAEQTEVAALAARNDLDTLDLTLVPHTEPRRRAGWPAELNAAVDAAIAAEQVRPPEGVSWADWERVLAARRVEATCPVEDLRHLGPEVEPNQVLLTVDEV